MAQPAPTPPQPADSGGCGGLSWNPITITRNAIDCFLRDLVVGAAEKVLSSFGNIVLTTPMVTAPGGRPHELWGISLGIANSGFALLVMVAGMLLMGSGDSENARYTLKDVGPRLVVAFAGANLSLLFAGKAIALANGLSGAFLGQGLGPDAVGPTIEGLLVAFVAGGPGFFALIALVVLVLALILSVLYVVRLCTLIVLVAAAPICMACHALPQTAGLARLWWRAFTGALAVQVIQSAVLVTAMRVFFDSTGRRQIGVPGSGLVDMIVAIALLWVLVRIPVWVGRSVMANSGSQVMRIVKVLVVQKALGNAFSGAGRAATAARSRPSGPRPSQPRPQPATPVQGTLW